MAEEIRDCRWPWNRLYIHVNGDVKPCCYAPLRLANISDGTDLAAIWSSPLMEEIRDAIKANEIHRVCAGAGCAYVRSRIPDDISRWKVFDVPAGLVSEHMAKLGAMGQPESCFGVALALWAAGRASEAFVWAERAADQRNEYAMAWLGMTYLASEPAKGVAWLERAAAVDYTPAMVPLARCLQHGTGTAHDTARAVELYRRAAARGDAEAYVRLGDCHRDGIGVEQNIDDARHYYEIALRRGAVDAREALEAVAKEKPRPGDRGETGSQGVGCLR